MCQSRPKVSTEFSTPDALRQMFEQAPGFMCFLRGPDHVFEVVNKVYLQLVGFRDVVGLRVRDAFPDALTRGVIEVLDNAFASGIAFVGRGRPATLTRTPGATPEDCLVDVVYQPIRDTTGTVVGIFVQGQDVTSQHRAEARRSFLVESIPVQVWTSLPDGRLDFVSDRVCKYFQMTAAEILGNGWQAVIHPEDLGECVARWTRSLATGEPYEVEFRLRRGDGVDRWHLGRANAERDAAGNIVAWFGTNTDIHDAKLAIAELLARSQYEQRLIGIVSHDLRNPLNAIGLAAGILGSSELDPGSQKTVARLSRAADRAARLIADLLDFAKGRIGSTIPINPRPTNLREIVEQVVDEFQLVAPARVVRIGHAGVEDGSWDADRIAQVISNLVGNALQHSAANLPITVESRIDGDGVVLAVKNEGVPIPETDLANLFEPFKQGHHAFPTRGSLGLGLYIAREVVVAHGGTIEVQSASGYGTCFTVRLPRFAPTTTVS